jgi:DinB family protein
MGTMTPDALADSLVTLFKELIDGPAADAAYMLNGGDPGLLRSLDRLTASQASAIPAGGGASIAAHVDHVRYGLSLMNRWAGGEANPWATADWTASWTRTTVTVESWAALRTSLATEARSWLDALGRPREYRPIELNGTMSSVAHLAYHLGAIRQIDRSIRGPAAS